MLPYFVMEIMVNIYGDSVVKVPSQKKAGNQFLQFVIFYRSVKCSLSRKNSITVRITQILLHLVSVKYPKDFSYLESQPTEESSRPKPSCWFNRQKAVTKDNEFKYK